MVKFRKASKPGVTVKFIGGRFMVTRDGSTVAVAVERQPHGDAEIMAALQGILTRY
ncbi:hypothetical protein [Sinomonas mesophila]|uniref:hypothetical protein n=1 Tax=Sinomonas mesophila TaxID=1531955 RepID=UPI00158B7865|nr:hypothetical protein [Sinomonas mesophila]